MSWIRGDNPKEQRHFDFLERLRQSGATNMWGASPYLRAFYPRDFPRKNGDPTRQAGEVLVRWIKLHDEPGRVNKKGDSIK
jgi:hypothetical protein